MCISLKHWGALYVSNFSILFTVEIKLYCLRGKTVLQSWLFLVNCLNFLLSIIIIGFFCYCCLVFFLNHSFQNINLSRNKKYYKRMQSVLNFHIWMHMSHHNILFWSVWHFQHNHTHCVCLESTQLTVTHPSIYSTFYRAGSPLHLITHTLIWVSWLLQVGSVWYIIW